MESILVLLVVPIATSNSKPHNKTHAHLEDPNIREICSVKDRALICASNNTNVCTVRKVNGGMEYRDYENHCYLFLSNMCEQPSNEFYIARSGPCEVNPAAEHVIRRQESYETANHEVGDTTEAFDAAITEAPNEDETLAQNEADATESPDDGEESETTAQGDKGYANEKPVARLRLVTSPVRYKVTEAYDGHKCPGHCPETYEPVCLIANRGFGLYFKYLTFLNHCQADMYYCGHSDEFAPPPDESEEMISGSKLDWSFCASYRFLQFARFSEVASSMGHYGWLLGDYKYSHILTPEEKVRLSGHARHVVGR